jgi:hypothetical protein
VQTGFGRGFAPPSRIESACVARSVAPSRQD